MKVFAPLMLLALAGVTACSNSEAPVSSDVAFGTGGKETATGETVQVKVLSNRADLISGGDALVEVVVPAGKDLLSLKVDVAGTDASDKFALRENGRVMGLVTDLVDGPNVLAARLADAPAATITITNHSAGGPVIAPQLAPWVCSTDLSGLGAALDDKCNAAQTYEFQYRKADRSGFAAYDPAAPRDDVATTTTDQGNTVPYIVRLEKGAINRGLYQIAVLFDPLLPWAPWAAQKGWNHKVFYPFGASCNTNYNQGNFDSFDVMLDKALSRGFAVASSSLNVLGQICNPILSAETVGMVKERIVEQYGEIRYTYGEGGSGASIGQFVVANAYPGLLQGLIPSETFPDNTTTGVEVIDCHLLLLYFTTKSPQLWTDDAQQAAVNGHEGITSCMQWEGLFVPVQDPTHGCSIGPGQSQSPGATLPPGGGRSPGDYNAIANPTGCRATIQDVAVAIYGRRNDGFAKGLYDNVGVQYGLRALEAGTISVDQFLDLNERIGGVDIDNNFVANRTVADPGAVRAGYMSGLINDTRGLGDVAIIDLPAATNIGIHTPFHAFSVEARLTKAFGHADNHAIWRGGPADLAFVTMDQWLAAVEADTGSDSRAVKVARDRPAKAIDSCFINSAQSTDVAACDAAWPYFGDSRIAAGAPIVVDQVKCTLKPRVRSDYAVKFTDAQWQRMKALFADGVCDWTVPGVDQVPSRPWSTYMDGPGGVPLPAPPVSASE